MTGFYSRTELSVDLSVEEAFLIYSLLIMACPCSIPFQHMHGHPLASSRSLTLFLPKML